jgi:DNA-binding MarR family transcriptional regulator
VSRAEAGEGRIAELAGGLRTAVNRLAHALRAPAAEHGVTPTRLTALAILERHGPMRPGTLATRMKITPASMSRLTDVLEEGAWVAREPDPDDGRACLLRLSDHGAATLAALRLENATELAGDIGALSSADQAKLEAALPVLTALADRQLDRQLAGDTSDGA